MRELTKEEQEKVMAVKDEFFEKYAQLCRGLGVCLMPVMVPKDSITFEMNQALVPYDPDKVPKEIDDEARKILNGQQQDEEALKAIYEARASEDAASLLSKE